MIVMKEDLLGEAKIWKGRTNHQGAIQDEDIKLMLVDGHPVLTPITTLREATTPTPKVLKMKVLPELLLCHPTPMIYFTHQMKKLGDPSLLKVYHTLHFVTWLLH